MDRPIAIATKLCEEFEGLRLKAYLCPAGVPTLGFGSTGADIKLGMTCDRAWAYQRLRSDLARFLTRDVLPTCPILATQPACRVAAVLDWTYNLGGGRLRSSSMTKRINKGDWAGAAKELRKWVYGGGKKLRGLELRREAEVQHFMLLADMLEQG